MIVIVFVSSPSMYNDTSRVPTTVPCAWAIDTIGGLCGSLARRPPACATSHMRCGPAPGPRLPPRPRAGYGRAGIWVRVVSIPKRALSLAWWSLSGPPEGYQRATSGVCWVCAAAVHLPPRTLGRGRRVGPRSAMAWRAPRATSPTANHSTRSLPLASVRY